MVDHLRPVSASSPANGPPPAGAATLSWGAGLAIGSAFAASGFAALLYQVVWQRFLFAIIGINLASVTVVVTAFLLGLGLGSLLGGFLSVRLGRRTLAAFAIIELSIGIFGMCSLWVYGRVAAVTLDLSPIATGFVVLLALLPPTLLMGSTLPILASFAVGFSGNVGRSVANLYFVNTLGSAVASAMAVMGLLASYGQSGTVRVAVGSNLVAALAIAVLALWGRR